MMHHAVLKCCTMPNHSTGSSVSKYQDDFPSKPCTFEDTSGIVSSEVTRCADWEAATEVLRERNNTAANPCRMRTGGAEYSVPRIVVCMKHFERQFGLRFDQWWKKVHVKALSSTGIIMLPFITSDCHFFPLNV